MGKKSKQKKQRQKHHPVQPSSSGVQIVEPAAPTAAATPRTKMDISDIHSERVRQDISRILILLACVAVLLGGMYVLQEKTTLLQSMGNRLSDFLRL